MNMKLRKRLGAAILLAPILAVFAFVGYRMGPLGSLVVVASVAAVGALVAVAVLLMTPP